MASIKDTDKAYELLKNYSGENFYILVTKKLIYNSGKSHLNDFQIEYILKNHNFNSKEINKIVNITDWYGEKLKEKLEIDFKPSKLKIIKLLGETEKYFHCTVMYRQSEKPVFLFIPKNAVLNNFLVEDYKGLKLDFSWFDKQLQKINPEWSVMEHQKESVKFLLSRKKCILSLDMGLGKSMSSIIASLMYGNKKVLVICPASIKTNWKNELSRFVDEENINIIKGINEMNKDELMKLLGIADQKQYKVNELRELAKEHGKWNEGKQFTILNFDIIDDFHKASRKKNNEDSDLLKSDFDVVIIDEAHKLSDNKSNRFKTVKNYLRKANNEYTWLLTGTMITNDTKNLYNLLSLIENEITSDYDYFMERYCGAEKVLKKGEWDRCWNMWNKKRGYDSYSSLNIKQKEVFRDYVKEHGSHATIMKNSTNLEELNQRIKHLYYRRTKDEVIDIKKIIVPIVYNLTNEQKKEYDRLWDEYEKECLDNGNDVSEIKQLIEVGLYRQYISSIMVPNTINLTNKLLSHNKKVFIVCCYDDELYKLKEHFGDIAVIFNGKMTQKQKDDAVDKFNNDDNIKIIIGQIKAIGVGINLNKSCNHCIFQNLDFTDAAFSQACDRIFRIGSKNDAYIYLQYFKNTIYEHMVEIIERKREISNIVIENS